MCPSAGQQVCARHGTTALAGPSPWPRQRATARVRNQQVLPRRSPGVEDTFSSAIAALVDEDGNTPAVEGVGDRHDIVMAIGARSARQHHHVGQLFARPPRPSGEQRRTRRSARSLDLTSPRPPSSPRIRHRPTVDGSVSC